MSDFWKLSDNTDLTTQGTDGAFDAGGGKIEVIPEGTQLLAAIDEAKWDRNLDGDKFINIRWTILQPEELAGRKVFQKLWVSDADPRAKADKVAAKRDKAKKMLARPIRTEQRHLRAYVARTIAGRSGEAREMSAIRRRIAVLEGRLAS